jgi:hypothetical protein
MYDGVYDYRLAVGGADYGLVGFVEGRNKSTRIKSLLLGKELKEKNQILSTIEEKGNNLDRTHSKVWRFIRFSYRVSYLSHNIENLRRSQPSRSNGTKTSPPFESIVNAAVLF